MVADPDKHIDPWMQRIGRLEQAEEVFRVRGANVADNVEGQQIGAVGLDSPDGGDVFQKIHLDGSSWLLCDAGTHETLCLFHQSSYR